MNQDNKDFYESDYGKRILKNRMNTLELNMPFLKVFGVRLKLYWDGNILGFDVLKFDKFLCPEQNESSFDCIERKFGQEGIDIIKKLLLIDE